MIVFRLDFASMNQEVQPDAQTRLFAFSCTASMSLCSASGLTLTMSVVGIRVGSRERLALKAFMTGLMARMVKFI